jgi:hypothetical protein
MLLLVCAALALGFQGEWVKFSPPEGRFSILMPSQPEAAAVSESGNTGYRYVVLGNGHGFVCMYLDLPPTSFDRDTFLDATSDGIVHGAKATKVREQKISLEGYSGRELEYALNRPDRPGTARTRFFLVGRRLYSLTFVSADDFDPKLKAEQAAKFFSSFKLMAE